MNYIVLDLEWNQSYRGKEYSIDEMPFEIIQIGAVKLDEHKNIIDKWDRIIRPVIYTKLHNKVQEMLGISQNDLENGDDFNSAAEEFIEWCGEEYEFVTWGGSDLTELQRNMEYFGVKNNFKFPLTYYDLQKLYSILYSDGKSRTSLKNAIEALELSENVVYHSAINDAIYTADIFRKMDFESVKVFKSIDTYRIPANRKQEIYMNFGTYEKYISKGFKNRDTAANDRTARACKCYICGKTMKRTLKWFATSSKIYYGLFYCDEHGAFKGKLKVKHNDNGMYYDVRIIKRTDDAGVKKIYDRQQKEKEHRRKKRLEERNKKSAQE